MYNNENTDHDNTKMESEDAKDFVTSFRHATPNIITYIALQLNPDYKCRHNTVLNYATQTINDCDNCERQSRLIDQEHATVFQDNGREGVELQSCDGATTFRETFTAEDSMTPAMDLQDSMDDIEARAGIGRPSGYSVRW